jgi:asparagine synthase (glutamine-hydrolysing)
MCGIGGVFSTAAQIEPGVLRDLADALKHRGPDGEGVWISSDGCAGMVHRRLAILDTSELGLQPMHSVDGRYTIVFNGEIFNFIELRDELRSLGCDFVSDSDTEVILEAWRHWGEGMLLRFNGMWALAIRDNLTRDVFFARDRFGIKPLVYCQFESGLAFASEVRALLSLPMVPRALDVKTATRMLFDPFSIEGGDCTLLQGVRRLPAGHCATLRGNDMCVRRWWSTVDHLPVVPEDRAHQIRDFRKIFFDAVRIRLRSDVPLGTCLSGGFDSSAITCAIAEISRDHPHEDRGAEDWRHAFIASFPNQPNDEAKPALEVASYACVQAHISVMTDEAALDNIDQVLADLDDVYISLPTAPWQIYRSVRDAKVTVSLDGHGADELLGGYRQQNEGFGFRLRNWIASATYRQPMAAALFESAKATVLTLRGLNHIRGHQFVAPAAPGTPFDSDVLPPAWGALNKRLYRMFHATVLPTILRNFDRMSMAHGVEVRMPFMDWRLVTYAMALPDRAKSDAAHSKLIARQAMAGAMPEHIRMNTHKIGFNSPMPGWMNGPLGPWAKDLLSDETAVYSAIVDVPALQAQVHKLSSTKAWDWEMVGRLWPYIHLKWYIDKVINEPTRPSHRVS